MLGKLCALVIWGDEQMQHRNQCSFHPAFSQVKEDQSGRSRAPWSLRVCGNSFTVDRSIGQKRKCWRKGVLRVQVKESLSRHCSCFWLVFFPTHWLTVFLCPLGRKWLSAKTLGFPQSRDQPRLKLDTFNPSSEFPALTHIGYHSQEGRSQCKYDWNA